MKTNLFIASLFLAFLANAQNKKAGKIVFRANPEINQTPNVSMLPATCYTVTTITGSVDVATAASDTTVPGCDPLAGYVYGSNCYADQEKATFINGGYYGSVSQPSVSAVIVNFFKFGNMGTGGTSSVTANVIIYSGTLASGPASVVATLTANLGQIVAAQGTNTPLFDFTYVLPTAVAIPTSGIFCSLVLPTTAGDTAVVSNQDPTPTDLGWEKWNDNTWHSINSAWSINANLSMSPVICGSTITAVSANAGISKNIFVMPNPSSGLIRISVNGNEKQKLEIKISDMLGRTVLRKEQDCNAYDVFPVDFSENPRGVYLITVSNGTDQMTQKLIIEK